jgi:hypothetical protein
MIPNPSLVVPERTLLAASHKVQQTLDFIEAEGLVQTTYITTNGDQCYPWLEAMILVQ